MNDQGLQTAQTNAQNAATSASALSTSAPDLLTQLKQNLVGIFSDNNPIVTARNGALSDYLSENANSRAAMLPANVGDVPGVAGRPLTLSPTEQDAITTSKNAAALAPLNGYNAILQAMFGQVPDMITSAGNIYGAQINSANDAAKTAEQHYQDAIAQYNAEKPSAGSSGILDDPTIAAILRAIRGGGTKTAPTVSLDDIFGFPTTSTQNTIPKSSGSGSIPVPKKVSIPAPKKTTATSNPTLGGYSGLNTSIGTGF